MEQRDPCVLSMTSSGKLHRNAKKLIERSRVCHNHTANPRHQEKEKKNKNIHAQNKQTSVREAKRPAPSSPSEMIRMLKQREKRGQRPREDFKTLSAPWYKPQSYTELRTTPGPRICLDSVLAVLKHCSNIRW